MTLDKGIKFAPKKGLNKFETYVGVQKFIRKLNIKKYYALNPVEKMVINNKFTNLRNNSVFNPHVANNKYVDLFKKLVTTELEQLPIKRAYEHRDFKKGLSALEKRDDIVIRPADKGGGIVVLSLQQYKDEMNRILSDNSTYHTLSADPSKVFKKELDLIIKQGVDNKFLNKQEAKYLIPTVSRIPVIYYLPKIHKDSSNPPGRPIVSGIESLTSRLGEYIDLHLQPLVRKTQAYLKDTKHTLQLLREHIKENDVIMVTGDVSSLYTNIDHDGALEAVEWALDKEEGIDKGLCGFILKCLDFCLHHNFFLVQQ